MAFGHLRAHTLGNFAFHNHCTEVKYALPQVWVAYSRQEIHRNCYTKGSLALLWDLTSFFCCPATRWEYAYGAGYGTSNCLYPLQVRR